MRSCTHGACTRVFYLSDLGPAFQLLKADTLAERLLLEPGAWAWAFHSALEMGSGITDASSWTTERPGWRNKALQAGPRAGTVRPSHKDSPEKNSPWRVCEVPGPWPLFGRVTSLDIKVGTCSQSWA